MNYMRFAAMIITSTVVMFCLTYVNVYQADHILFSQTRIWMAIVMGSAMAVIACLLQRGQAVGGASSRAAGAGPAAHATAPPLVSGGAAGRLSDSLARFARELLRENNRARSPQGAGLSCRRA